VGGTNDHGRGIGEHCHRPLVCKAMGEKSLRGQVGGIMRIEIAQLFAFRQQPRRASAMYERMGIEKSGFLKLETRGQFT
jgi:hypothetical protein